MGAKGIQASSAANILIDVYLQKLLHTPQPHTAPCSTLCLGIYFYFYFYFRVFFFRSVGRFFRASYNCFMLSHIFRH